MRFSGRKRLQREKGRYRPLNATTVAQTTSGIVTANRLAIQMRYLRPFIFLLLSLPAFAQHTYYVSKSSGSDANTPTKATNKSTPWQHLPGMAGCRTGCAAISGWTGPLGPGNGYVPVPGDQFILYGGDTWTSTDLPLNWNGSGTGQCVTTPNSSCIYIGVDQTWYNASVCGSSWCRPTFDGGRSGIISYAVVMSMGLTSP